MTRLNSDYAKAISRSSGEQAGKTLLEQVNAEAAGAENEAAF